MSNCVHCSNPDACDRVCDRCPCLHCVTARDTPESDAWCLACVRWVGTLGFGVRATVARIAREQGTTLAEARTQLLTAYHDHHIHRRSTDE